MMRGGRGQNAGANYVAEANKGKSGGVTEGLLHGPPDNVGGGEQNR